MNSNKPTSNTDSRKISEIAEDTSQAKRRLLSGLGAGGSVLGISALVPASWVKPAINTVMLPAHAQLTEAPGVTEARGVPVINSVEISTNDSTSATELVVSWGPPEDAEAAANVDSYEVRYRKDEEGEDFSTPVPIALGSASDGTFEHALTLSGEMPGDPYVVEVRAVYDATADGQPASTADDTNTIATGMAMIDPGPTEEELAAIAARAPATITVEGDGDTNGGLGQTYDALLRAYVAWTPPSDSTAAGEVDAYVVSWRNVTETEFRTNSGAQTRGASVRNTFTPTLPPNDPITRADSWFVQVEAVYHDSSGSQPEADVGKYVITTTVTTDALLTTIFGAVNRTLRITNFNDVGPYTGLLGQLDDLLN